MRRGGHGTFGWLCSAVGGRAAGIGVLTLLQAIASLAGVLFALLCRRVIDSAASGSMDGIYRDGAALLLVMLAQIACYFLIRVYGPLLEARLDIRLQKRFLHAALTGSYEKVSAYHTGSLLSRIQGDVGTVCGWCVSFLPTLAGIVVRLLGAFFVLFALDRRFTLCMSAICILVAAASGLYRSRLRGLSARVRESGERIVGCCQEAFSNTLAIRAFHAGERMEARAGQLLEERYGLFRRRVCLTSAAGTGMRLVFQGIYTVGILWCVRGIAVGTMTYGTLTAVVQLLHQLQSPVSGLSGAAGQTTSMLVSAERLMEIEALADGGTHAEPLPEGCSFAWVEAEALSFSWPGREVLEQTSFCLRRGQRVLLRGESGCGKTTFLKLLTGICPHEAIHLVTGDGRVFSPENVEGLFAYVPQGNLLFSGTVRDNICFLSGAKPEEEELRSVLHASAVEEYLDLLPDGLDTVIGERGFGLSEGQAQRIAVARALMSGAPILILDEATSALDEALEARMLERISALPDRTCLIVSHRPAAERFCSEVWTIEHKKIVIKKKEE